MITPKATTTAGGFVLFTFEGNDGSERFSFGMSPTDAEDYAKEIVEAAASARRARERRSGE